jgi:AcrR family transcriptional regulator
VVEIEIRAELFTPSERDRFLDAMVALCAERGLEKLSAAAISERARLPVEAFERQFGSEEGVEKCILAAVNAIIGDVLSAVSSSYSADRSEWDSGILGMRAILEYMAANPAVAYFGYITTRTTELPGVREVQESARHVIAAMIDRLRENALDTAPPPRAARAALGAADAVVRREIAAGRAAELPRLLPDLVYGATVAFLGQEEALRLARRGRQLLRGSAWA